MLHDLGKLVIMDNDPPQAASADRGGIRADPHAIRWSATRSSSRCASSPARPSAVRHHHERYDGKGYPDGLKGDDIPLIARVVTVADAFDAMTSDRPYRSKRAAGDGHARRSCAAPAAQFDPLAADAFLDDPAAAAGADQPPSRSSVGGHHRRCGGAAGGRPLTESTRPKILVVDDARTGRHPLRQRAAGPGLLRSGPPIGGETAVELLSARSRSTSSSSTTRCRG